MPLIGEHVPLSSLSVLLTVSELGYDVSQAARDYIHIKSFETMGKLYKISIQSGDFLFYDHSHRASILNYKSALTDLARFTPEPGGRKIAVIGNMLNIGKISKKAHQDLAPLIEQAQVDRLYTVGRYAKPIHDKLTNPSILICHGKDFSEIEAEFLADIRPGDIVFIKGHHRIWLKKLAAKVLELGATHEIR